MLTPALLLVLAAEGPRVGVVSAGDEKLANEAAATPNVPVSLTTLAAPAAQPAPDEPSTEPVVLARKAWVSADFAKCQQLLEDDGAIVAALNANARSLVSRTLAWRVACKLGARQPDGARRDAEWLAALQLPFPEDVGVMTPDVEALLAEVRRQVDSQPRSSLGVTSTMPGASVTFDGRPDACITPCTMNVAAGVHALKVSADGYSPQVKAVTVGATGATVELSLLPADPPLAARQWHQRRARGTAFDEGTSLALLSIALRSARLIVVGPSETPNVLRGALSIDGVVQARGEREDVQALVQDLLVRGKVYEPDVPLWKRWPFWVAVGVAAVATAVTTGVLVSRLPIITKVVIRP